MAPQEFLPADFDPPRSLVTEQFRLEPLGPQHNEADLAAWSSSVEHIRATPGYPDGSWPPVEGMTPERNRADLERHASDFEARRGFTFTVLNPADEVVGCVYLYPAAEIPEAARRPERDVSVQSWVRADHAHLDEVLALALVDWIAVAWPWSHPYRYGR
ncbi:N-acetyltransferase [Citricoccus muralis]|uniref:N-acetyltransferase n=1 Tax=Citricoccus muralis TaxID=169134 RepID=A0ABY8H650_9MICC|nr:N-acetyltransferase [Citricoccus muralis]WFP16138.1 N-acetyltransferase [Citricoccus muralis]